MEMMQIKIIDINLVRRLGGIVHTLSKERAEDLINSGKAILIKTIKEKEIKEELDENGEVILEKTTWNIGDSIFPDFLFSVVG